ncbi:hypothetical protein T4A_6880 [Trichinella pseudospiralis]|uniref:Uncharacterized protein n=1 Tax=Trichinella pseudospiralis TaxID=6337 RepID=A0A0V1DJ01_TRIPS|nr:hypothetical protein T4A_6880 [Trichinella pseudospiralis]
MVSRSALVGGIWGQIRTLWLKDRVQSKQIARNFWTEDGSVAEKIR